VSVSSWRDHVFASWTIESCLRCGQQFRVRGAAMVNNCFFGTYFSLYLYNVDINCVTAEHSWHLCMNCCFIVWRTM